MTRHHYTIDLTDWVDAESPAEPDIRAPTPNDAEALARLMLDAYRGTIDFEGDETIEDARQEVGDYLGLDSADLTRSRLALVAGRLASACLVNSYATHSFVGYVMTHPDHKGHGIGTATLRASLRALAESGHRNVSAFITEGNTPSEAMFAAVGAVSRPTHVFHIAATGDWDQRGDTYVPASFAEEGFIHCSTEGQLERVAKQFYAGRDDLTLLTIPAVEMGSALIYEDLYDSGESFPHVYARIPTGAVTEAVEYSVR